MQGTNMPGCEERSVSKTRVQTNLNQASNRPESNEVWLHSATVLKFRADVVQCHDILAELQIVGQLIGTSEVGQEFDDVLLLVDEVLGKLVTTLLELLLGSELDDFLTLLGEIFSGSLALAGDRLAGDLTLQRRGRLGGGTLKLVNTLHVIEQVVATRESVSRNSTLAVLKVTEVRPGTVSMHAVSLALVAQQASSRGKLNTNTGLLVAAEWFQVRVDVLIVVALERCRLVGATGLALLGAVVLAILIRALLVESVAAGNLCAFLLKLDFCVGG